MPLKTLTLRLTSESRPQTAGQRSASSLWLGCNLLVGKLWDIGSLVGVLYGDAADIPFTVNVKDRILIKLLGFGYVDSAKLNV